MNLNLNVKTYREMKLQNIMYFVKFIKKLNMDSQKTELCIIIKSHYIKEVENGEYSF